MRILLTNDDGLFTNGMLHLEEELSQLAETWCIAPDRERSATSQALTLRETLIVQQIAERKYTVNGFPTDCVNVALFAGGFPFFDLVVSGINHGVNMGDDVHYSGTVGAARHAALHGRKSVAVSCPIREHDGDFRAAARWVREWLAARASLLQPRIVWNINYPAVTNGRMPEGRITFQGKRSYHDEYELIEDAPGRRILKLKETTMGNEIEPGSDFDAFDAGFVSLTPLSTSTTAAVESPERYLL
jgi:5'-nucleotidase